MNLWKNNGSQWQVVPWAAGDLGLDVFLCCPGPSLADVKDSRLHAPGAMIVAMNTAYPHIRPDLWIGMDEPDCYDSALWAEPFRKIARGGKQLSPIGGRPWHSFPQMYFASCEEVAEPVEMFNRLDDSKRFIWTKSTFMIALHLLVRMGAKRIHLVGCDFGGDRDYYDERKLPDDLRKYNRQLYKEIVQDLYHLHTLALVHGVELTSCTPESPANDFMDYTPLADALRAATDRHELPSTKPLHSVHAEAARWPTSEPTAPRGVVTGCDFNHEWMLEWWLEHLREHNADLPVAFADFGMTAAAREWCRQHGELIDCRDVPVNGWLKKPFAILRAPFEQILWLDTDCEVRKSILPIFEFEGEGLAVTLDPYTPFCDCKDPYAAGVIRVCRGNEIVMKWARIILLSGLSFRGDQEALNKIADVSDMTVMPREFQWLRLDKIDNPDAVIMHWTGPDGKKHIRDHLILSPSKSRIAASLPSM